MNIRKEGIKISKKFIPLLFAMLLMFSACSNGNINANSQTEPDVSVSNVIPVSEESKPSIENTESTPPQQLEIDNAKDGRKQIRLRFDNQEAIVSLEANPTTKDLLSQLPLTLTFEDFNQIEKICRIPDKLSDEGMPDGVDPDIGDVTLYVPWNTLVFYYEEFGYHKDLIPIGRVESGLDALAGMKDDFVVTIENAENSETDLTQSANPADNNNETNITMTVGNEVITATLDNSTTTKEFLQTLPRTMTMTRWGDREYYGRLEAALSEDGERIEDFSNGDVTFYPAGPSFAVFFAKEDSSSLSGLIRMGRITSNLSAFDTFGDSVEMLIEIAP